jgi:GrpB-like predicted nucleotidyltransferase (UPF0157 family)
MEDWGDVHRPWEAAPDGRRRVRRWPLESGASVMVASMRLAAHDPAWASQFRRERARLLRAAGTLIEGVEHVGSTAVPALLAQPSIDILVGLREGVSSHLLDQALTGLGYGSLVDEVGDIPRHVRVVAIRGAVFHVHVVPYDGRAWRRMVSFRDYLLSHPGELTYYGELKQVAAEWGHELYCAAKSVYFKRIGESHGAALPDSIVTAR